MSAIPTRPTSKIIQILSISQALTMKFIVLCQDGSVWWMNTDTVNGEFKLIALLGDKSY